MVRAGAEDVVPFKEVQDDQPVVKINWLKYVLLFSPLTTMYKLVPSFTAAGVSLVAPPGVSHEAVHAPLTKPLW
jgi:hypothetical protein